MYKKPLWLRELAAYNIFILWNHRFFFARGMIFGMIEYVLLAYTIVGASLR